MKFVLCFFKKSITYRTQYDFENDLEGKNYYRSPSKIFNILFSDVAMRSLTSGQRPPTDFNRMIVDEEEKGSQNLTRERVLAETPI